MRDSVPVLLPTAGEVEESGTRKPPISRAAVHRRDQAPEGLSVCPLGAVSGLGITLSRPATDLQLWSTAEFGFVRFPVEVNPRLAGGVIPVAIEGAMRADLVDATIAWVCGQPAPETGPGAGHSAIRFAVAPHGGTVAALTGSEPARSVPGIAAADYIVAADGTVTISHSFKDRLGYAIGTGPDAGTAERAAVQALALLNPEIEERKRPDGESPPVKAERP